MRRPWGPVSYSTNHRFVCPSSDPVLVTTSMRIGHSPVAASASMTMLRMLLRTSRSSVLEGRSRVAVFVVTEDTRSGPAVVTGDGGGVVAAQASLSKAVVTGGGDCVVVARGGAGTTAVATDDDGVVAAVKGAGTTAVATDDGGVVAARS